MKYIHYMYMCNNITGSSSWWPQKCLRREILFLDHKRWWQDYEVIIYKYFINLNVTLNRVNHLLSRLDIHVHLPNQKLLWILIAMILFSFELVTLSLIFCCRSVISLVKKDYSMLIFSMFFIVISQTLKTLLWSRW